MNSNQLLNDFSLVARIVNQTKSVCLGLGEVWFFKRDKKRNNDQN